MRRGALNLLAAVFCAFVCGMDVLEGRFAWALGQLVMVIANGAWVWANLEEKSA